MCAPIEKRRLIGSVIDTARLRLRLQLRTPINKCRFPALGHLLIHKSAKCAYNKSRHKSTACWPKVFSVYINRTFNCAARAANWIECQTRARALAKSFGLSMIMCFKWVALSLRLARLMLSTCLALSNWFAQPIWVLRCASARGSACFVLRGEVNRFRGEWIAGGGIWSSCNDSISTGAFSRKFNRLMCG